jgi:hypothetical protein
VRKKRNGSENGGACSNDRPARAFMPRPARTCSPGGSG